MTYGRALVRSFLPAIVIGPGLGLLGVLALFVVSAIFSGQSSAPDGFLLIAAFFGAIIGLVVAGPACLFAGAALLVLASRDLKWADRGRVAFVGSLVGATFALLIGGISMDGAAILVTIGGGAALGAIGALIFRHLTASAIENDDSVDPDVFA